MIKIKSQTTTTDIYKYGLLIAGIIELGSLLFIGWDSLFAYGLVLGTCVAIGNYNIHVFSASLSITFSRGFIMTMLGYIIRLMIYGGFFLVSYNTGMTSGIATLLGYLTVKIAIIYVYGVKPGFRSKRYDATMLNDLDSDPWSAERTNKPSRFGRHFT